MTFRHCSLVAWVGALLLHLSCAAQAPQAPAVAAVDAAATSAAAITIDRPPLLPNAITSFGAARAGGWLYVYGGHIGRAHSHSRDNVLGTFHRLNLADGVSWQALPSGPPLQGTALVADEHGRLYRVGGTDARNAPGEDDDMHSTDTVARFDPAQGRWQSLAPLPEPRSSHDAIVCDGKLYVIGGWCLAGEGDGDWHDTAWVADLAEEPLVWRELPPIGHARRACAVATFAGKIAVLGGIDRERAIATVRVFDPATSTWSAGPDLPGFAFGTAALGVGDRLYATVMDGRLLQWDGHGEWQTVTQLQAPRFFHRLVPDLVPGRMLALGGAGRGGHMRTIETLTPGAGAAVELREYVIPAPGRVAYRQALLVEDDTIWAFGGNRGDAGERFAPTQFATDIWKVELGTMTAEHVAQMPSGCQSMASVRWGDRDGNLLLGGLGVHGGQVASSRSGFTWDSRRRQLRPFGAELPAPLTQFELVHHDGRVFAIGGVDFTPDESGGSSRGDARQVFVCDPRAETPAFVPAGFELPRPRRSFGAAVVEGRLYLIGGLGDGFEHAGPCDVYDFATGVWSELAAPMDWVSPQVATIGSRIYVACGGTMQGQRFTADPSVRMFEPGSGWRTVVAALPFAVRHVHMVPLRNRLLFYSANEERRDRIVIRTLLPDAAVTVVEAAFHR